MYIAIYISGGDSCLHLRMEKPVLVDLLDGLQHAMKVKQEQDGFSNGNDTSVINSDSLQAKIIAGLDANQQQTGRTHISSCVTNTDHQSVLAVKDQSPHDAECCTEIDTVPDTWQTAYNHYLKQTETILTCKVTESGDGSRDSGEIEHNTTPFHEPIVIKPEPADNHETQTTESANGRVLGYLFTVSDVQTEKQDRTSAKMVNSPNTRKVSKGKEMNTKTKMHASISQRKSTRIIGQKNNSTAKSMASVVGEKGSKIIGKNNSSKAKSSVCRIVKCTRSKDKQEKMKKTEAQKTITNKVSEDEHDDNLKASGAAGSRHAKTGKHKKANKADINDKYGKTTRKMNITQKQNVITKQNTEDEDKVNKARINDKQEENTEDEDKVKEARINDKQEEIFENMKDSHIYDVTTEEDSEEEEYTPNVKRKRVVHVNKNTICDMCGKRVTNIKTHKKREHTNECSHPCPVLTSSKHLAHHIKGHGTPNNCLCRTCGKSFKTFKNLKKHEVTHTEDRTFMCSKCGKLLKTSTGLQSHMVIHSGHKPFVCTECGKMFARAPELTRHMYIHTGIYPFKCQACDQKFTKKAEWKRHERWMHTANRDRPIKCEVCGMGFLRTYHLNRHMNTHTGAKLYRCHHCGNRYSQVSNLNKHIKNAHSPDGEEGQFPKKKHCPICDKSVGELSYHMKIHTGDRSHQCDICGHRFLRPVDLTMHMRSHTGERPHKCPDCELTYKRSNHLLDHRRRVHGHPPSKRQLAQYTCDFCNKIFRRSSDMKQHRRSHTGERPFPCKVCGKALSRSSHRVKHMRVIHGIGLKTKHSSQAARSPSSPLGTKHEQETPVLT